MLPCLILWLTAMSGFLVVQVILRQLSALFVLSTIDEDPVFLRYALTIRRI